MASWLQNGSKWWCMLLQPVAAFKEPLSGRRPGRNGYVNWTYEMFCRMHRRKPLTASINRHFRRYITAQYQHDQAVRKHQAAVIVTGLSVKGLLPLMVLLLICMVAQATATPELLQGLQLLTSNLAAWELSHLAGWRFSAAADYNSIQHRPAAVLYSSAAAHRVFHQYAAPAGISGFPTYPGAVDPLQLDDLLPEGRRSNRLKDAYTKDEEHGWSYGNHPDATPEHQAWFKDMLVRNKAAFAYSMKELPGYTGDPVSIKLVHDKPIISKPRQYSRLEEEIREEKCVELKEAGFIEPADPRNPYASCPTMPAKKNEQGEWVERRYSIDYRFRKCLNYYTTLLSGLARTAVSTGGRPTLPQFYRLAVRVPPAAA